MRSAAILALAIITGCATPPPPPPPPPPVEVQEEEPMVEVASSRSVGMPMAGSPAPVPKTNCDLFAESDGAGKMTCVSVLYGTNRTLSDDRPDVIRSDATDRKRNFYDQGDLFSIRPDSRENCEPNAVAWSETRTRQDVCHLGEVVVSVPAKRDKKLERGGGTYRAAASRSKISARSVSKYFTLFDHRSFDGDPEGFTRRVEQILAQSSDAEGHAFVYIHGFNVPFRSAVFRTAQLKYDMDFDGPAFVFSWPSNGALLDYLSDQEDADLSVDALVRFLRFTHTSVNQDTDRPVKLHIIAHSMGTRVTAQALARLSDFEDSPSFGHVVFAAGDLDTNLFEEWMGASSRLYEGVTIYTSRQDRAVGFSGWLRNLSRKMAFWGANNDIKRRIGFYEKRSSPSTFDLPTESGQQLAKTIDISAAAKNSFLFKVRHSVYAESKIITDDIRFLFDHPYSDPDQRSALLRQLCPGDAHWTYATEKQARRHRDRICPSGY
ncbi:MAG: alpha/beta hydrolase [Henriciella sp.]